LADAALTVNEALYNFDLIKFYHNYLTLISDLQRKDGAVPDYVPGHYYPVDTNWGTALPTITWQVYRHYNNVQTLEDYYKNNLAYIEFLYSFYLKTGIANFSTGHGDWVPPPPFQKTNVHLVTSYGFLHDVNLLVNMSKILGKKNDTDTYSALYQRLTEEFHRAFYNTSGNFYADGMQAAQILALALPGVVPANLRQTVVDYLVSDIRQKDIHVTTGIISTAELYPVLSDNGHHDLALELISSTTYPSYGFMFNNPYENATTIWELWSAPFTAPHMNSRNQAMYASVGAWFYSHLAGIDLSSDTIIIRPRMASENKKHLMSKLDCQLSTLYGIVHVSYTRDEHDTIPNSILLRVSIPPNVRSRIMYEPLFVGAQCKRLMESGKLIWSSDMNIGEIEGFEIQNDDRTGIMTVYVGSGDYEFQALWH
jgi:alpha-L-rhamnosidase